MVNPQEIIRLQQEKQQAYATRKAHVGLIQGIIQDAKKFFLNLGELLVDRATAKTLTVKVDNQIELPKVQEIEGRVSLKETKDLLTGLEAVRVAVAKLSTLSKDINKLSTDLKPKPVDFSQLEKAIRAIEIPETVIPEAPDTVSVSNLTEVVSAIHGIKIPTPEKVVIPQYPKSISVDNLAPLGKKIDALTEAVTELVKKPVPATDLSPIVKALKNVEDSVQAIRIPIPNIQSSWNHSMDMQSKDLPKTFSYTTVNGTKVVSYIQFVAKDGFTYRKTYGYSSNDPDNPDSDSGWIKQ